MSVETEPLVLALLTGIGFGLIAHWLWGWSAGKTAAVLVLFWFLQTFAQQLLRIFDGVGTWDEAFTVGSYRLVFGVAAVVVAGLLHREYDE